MCSQTCGQKKGFSHVLVNRRHEVSSLSLFLHRTPAPRRSSSSTPSAADARAPWWRTSHPSSSMTPATIVIERLCTAIVERLRAGGRRELDSEYCDTLVVFPASLLSSLRRPWHCVHQTYVRHSALIADEHDSFRFSGSNAYAKFYRPDYRTLLEGTTKTSVRYI